MPFGASSGRVRIMRLWVKILLSTVIPLAILIAIVIRWDLSQTRDEVTDRVKNKIRASVHGSALLLDGELRRAAQVANTAALAFADVSEWTSEETRQFAHSIVAHDPVIYGFTIAWDVGKGPSGKGLEAMSARRDAAGVKEFNLAKIMDYSKDPRFEKVRSSKEPLWSKTLQGTDLEKLDIVLYLSPIINDANFIGATVVDVEVDQLGSLHRRIGLGEAPWWLIDEKGDLIGTSDNEITGTALNPTNLGNEVLKLVKDPGKDGLSLLSALEDQESLSVIREVPSRGDEKLVLAIASVPLTNWTLVSIRSLDQQMQPVRSEVALRAVGSVSVGLVAIAIVLIGLWRVVLRPIRRLADVITKIGDGDFDVRTNMRGKDELAMLGRLIDRTVPSVKELIETRASLDAARDVQNTLLPQEAYQDSYIMISGRARPCDEIGGDFFDILGGANLGEGRSGFMLGDVTGHGVAAALLAATARAYLRGTLLAGVPLGSAISAANERINEDSGTSRFIVFIGAFYDGPKQELSLVAAGHPGFLLRKGSEEFEMIPAKGIPLGIDNEAEFPQTRFEGIGSGDLFMLASDGAWEARNSEGEEFGLKRLMSLVSKHRAEKPQVILDNIFQEISEWHNEISLEDDCTLVIAKMIG